MADATRKCGWAAAGALALLVTLLLVGRCVRRTGQIRAGSESAAAQAILSPSRAQTPTSHLGRSLARRAGGEAVSRTPHEPNEQGEPPAAAGSLSEKPPGAGPLKTDVGKTPPAVRERRAVDRFHQETDRWVRGDCVATVGDVRTFVRAFNAVPLLRRRECIRRATNLIPDANVTLLAGVLFDESQPKEIVRDVFNDIVNRSEEVKKPILKEIVKDKSHPCCSDAEWIFEVTGEKPE